MKYPGSVSREITEREKENAVIARRAAAEGMVLLENKENILPLAAGANVALYGGGALFTVKGGTGSGMVNNRYNVSIAEGLRNAGITLTNEDWLSDYGKRYARARADWEQWIYDNSVPGDFDSLYRTHATHPLVFPEGLPPVKTETNTAIYVVSRISGEGADRKAEKGDYYLSETEEKELAAVAALYENVIVILNVGGVMDTSFADRYGVKGLLLMCQAGQEGGNAAADVLTGRVNPSGRLTDTWAEQYEDYPSSDSFGQNNGNVIEEFYNEGIYVGYRYFDAFGVKPRYAFGYGLSYTTFSSRVKGTILDRADGSITTSVVVRNTGSRTGREVVFIFAFCPLTGDRRQPGELRRLIGFGKTPELASGDSAEVKVRCDLRLLTNYRTAASCWQLEAGDYYIYAGNTADPDRMEPAACWHVEADYVTEEDEPICELQSALRELMPDETAFAELRAKYCEDVRSDFMALDFGTLDPSKLITRQEIRHQPANYCVSEEARKILSGLSDDKKALLCSGRIKGGAAEFIGNAAVHVPGAAGETVDTETLPPAVRDTDSHAAGYPEAADTDAAKAAGTEHLLIMADGPAGLRLYQEYEVNPEDGSIYNFDGYQMLQNRIFGTTFPHEGSRKYYQFCTAFPVGMLLAQSFDEELLREVGRAVGREMREFGVSLWLAPGMNIHRNPLCGRNYEYYSEDPLVSGRMAAAITTGVEEDPHLGVTIKHFACNNQEENRRGVSSVVSERALREIYLRGFEIAVRTSHPCAIMTSYNRINGVHTANSYDLCTTAARNEWGFDGIIMTDWTTTNAGGGSSAAKCVAAGNDLTMPGAVSDYQEILGALHGTNDQCLAREALDAAAGRVLTKILEMTAE